MRSSTLGKAAFSAGVALALAFGVGEAVAAPAAQAARPYCSDDEHCQSICERLYPNQVVGGICSDGNTCYCYR